MFSHFWPRYRGTLVANPDLPARFAALAPIERSDRALHFTPGPHGYTDYPPYEPAH
jgi:N-ethylmaleimide reductase